MAQEDKKKKAAAAAVTYIEDDTVVGVGTGSTVNFFIEYLAKIKHRIDGVVSSSLSSERILKQYNIPIIPLNNVHEVSIYIDGADEATKFRNLIKGGGGALTGEKIVAAASKKFICIIDDSKLVDILGNFPLPVEVIPIAQSYVARQLVKLGGSPLLREGFETDHGNIILDVRGLQITQALELEQTINDIAGVVSNGIFAKHSADLLIVANDDGVSTI